MLPDWVSNPGPLTYESGALPVALHGPALCYCKVPVMVKLILVPKNQKMIIKKKKK